MFDSEFGVLGLSDNQKALYRAILETGKSTPARLSTLTGINRTTVYAVCKELVQKGFVQEDSLKGVTYYYPTPPKELVKITKRERQVLIEKELAIQELAKSIQDMPQSKSYAVPKIRFIEHEDAVIDFLYERTRSWLTSGEQPATWYGFLDGTFTAHEPYSKWIDWCWEQKESEFTELKMLSNETPSELATSARHERRHVKYLKNKIDFTATQWILGDYSVTVVSRQRPHYLVELHDAVYADNMRKLFKNLWEEIK